MHDDIGCPRRDSFVRKTCNRRDGGTDTRVKLKGKQTLGPRKIKAAILAILNAQTVPINKGKILEHLPEEFIDNRQNQNRLQAALDALARKGIIEVCRNATKVLLGGSIERKFDGYRIVRK